MTIKGISLESLLIQQLLITKYRFFVLFQDNKLHGMSNIKHIEHMRNKTY